MEEVITVVKQQHNYLHQEREHSIDSSTSISIEAYGGVVKTSIRFMASTKDEHTRQHPSWSTISSHGV